MAGKHNRDECSTRGTRPYAVRQEETSSSIMNDGIMAAPSCSSRTEARHPDGCPSKRRMLRISSSSCGASNSCWSGSGSGSDPDGAVSSTSASSSASTSLPCESAQSTSEAASSSAGGRQQQQQQSQQSQQQKGPLSRQQTSMTMSSASSSTSGGSGGSDRNWSRYMQGAPATTTSTASDSGYSASSSGRDGSESSSGAHMMEEQTGSNESQNAEEADKHRSSSDEKQRQRQQGQGQQGIRRPHANDVLCGRGRGLNSHPGNLKFRQFVSERKEAYILAATKEEKTRITREVLEKVRGLDPPGRFLVRNPNDKGGHGLNANRLHSADGTSDHAGSWVQTEWEKMFAKTSQALREGAPTVRATVKKILQDANLNPNPKLPWENPGASGGLNTVPATADQLRVIQRATTTLNGVGSMTAQAPCVANAVTSSSAPSSNNVMMQVQDTITLVDNLTTDQLKALSRSAVQDFRSRHTGADQQQEQLQQQQLRQQQQQQQQVQPQLTTSLNASLNNNTFAPSSLSMSMLPPNVLSSMSTLNGMNGSNIMSSLQQAIHPNVARSSSASSSSFHGQQQQHAVLPLQYQNLFNAASLAGVGVGASPYSVPSSSSIANAFAAHHAANAVSAIGTNQLGGQMTMQQAIALAATKQQLQQLQLQQLASELAATTAATRSSSTSPPVNPTALAANGSNHKGGSGGGEINDSMMTGFAAGLLVGMSGTSSNSGEGSTESATGSSSSGTSEGNTNSSNNNGKQGGGGGSRNKSHHHKSKKEKSKHSKKKDGKGILHHHSGQRKAKKRPLPEEGNTDPQTATSSSTASTSRRPGDISTRRSLSFTFSDSAMTGPEASSEGGCGPTTSLKSDQEFEDPFSTSESSKATTATDRCRCGGKKAGNKDRSISNSKNNSNRNNGALPSSGESKASNNSLPSKKGFLMKFKQNGSCRGSSVSSFSSDNDEEDASNGSWSNGENGSSSNGEQPLGEPGTPSGCGGGGGPSSDNGKQSSGSKIGKDYLLKSKQSSSSISSLSRDKVV